MQTAPYWEEGKKREDLLHVCVHILFHTSILWQERGIPFFYTYMKGTGYYD